VALDKLPGTFLGPSNLVEMLRHRVRYQGEDTAFVYLLDGEDERVEMSYQELDRQARAIGAWLESHGLAGERALLLYPAGLDFVAAFFGCLYAGVVAVPVYPPRRNRSLDRIQAIAADAEAKVALTTDVVLQRVEPLIEETPVLKQLAWLATCHVQPGVEEQWEMPDVHGDTTAFLQFTSGSTGTPKGVVLDHANLMHNSALIAWAFELSRSTMGVFWLPSYHDMGLIGGILLPLYVGRPNILMSPMAFLQKPFRWLSAISRFGGTISGGPNFAYDLCVRRITPEQRKTLDLSSWQVAFNGAEPVREETLNRFAETFAPCGFRREAFFPCYGMAEATLLVSGGYASNPPVIRTFETSALEEDQVADGEPGDEGVRGLVGCGSTIPDQKIVIADPKNMKRCDDEQVGEIWVRGPSVAQGYWRQPELTDEVFHARLQDTGEGPFLRTGDLGFIRDGELFVTGRLKDLIIIHGRNYYPQDVELTVEQAHRRLRSGGCAAFSVETDDREQLVVVQEVERRKKGGMESVYEAIRRDVAAEHDLVVNAIVLVKAGSIPKTSSGKIQRHACHKAYVDGTLAIIARWPATAARAVAGEKAAAKFGERKSTPVTSDAAAPVAESVAGRSSNGHGSVAVEQKLSVTDLVLRQVQAVAKERATGLTLDSTIAALGLDSLERMEILASLEECFGGRFPEEILPELETCRQMIEAVEKYLGTEPRHRATTPPEEEIPAETYCFDQFPEYIKLKASLELLKTAGLDNPYFNVHQSVTNNRTVIGGRELINFSSYNYIGMSGDPAVVLAAQKAVQQYGTSVSASRLVSGEKDLHGELEKAISRFIGTEDAIVFVGGHSTNETTIGHLLGPGDLVLHDGLAHNSIVQGCILSGARRRPFAHNDWEAADKLLTQFRHEYRRVLIVIEGVYSMDGDIPDLPKFIEVKRRHKALLMVDEAHSAGVLGEHGRGLGEYFHVDPRDVDLWMGTLSKSFGSCGGYIAACREVVEYLKYTAPGFVYSVGISPANAAAALASIRVLQAEPERAVRLRKRSKFFLDLARNQGLNTGMSKDSPVVPVILGNSMRCVQLSKALFVRGINVQPILYPAVEENAARLRFFITSLHTEDELRYTADAIAEELSKLDPEYSERPATGEPSPIKSVKPG